MNTSKKKRPWRHMALILTLMIPAALLTGCAAIEGEPCVGIAYRISGGNNDMVILGSIHVGNEQMRHYGQHIEDGMDAADTFVFECDSSSQEARQASARLMSGELKKEVSPQTYEKVQQVAQALDLPMSRFDGMRPWAVTSSLSTQIAAVQLGVKDAGAALKMGVEEQVRKRVGRKSVAYLETAEAQLTILNDFSPALQETLLKDACDMVLNPSPTTLKDWPDWWQAGDAEAFAQAYQEENELTDPVLTAEYHDALITKRNKAMAHGLSLLLQDEQPHCYFVTIGLLHLVLPGDSVLSELEAMGYTVERLGI